MTNTWKRIKGEGYDLIGTDYGVRASYGQAAESFATRTGQDFVTRPEYAVIKLSTDENIDWFDRCRDAKSYAERLAAREAQA